VGRVLLMSTAAIQDDWGHGAFTRASTKGLGGQANEGPVDGALAPRELAQYIASRVTERTQDRRHPHVPRRENSSPDSVVAGGRG
jgi:hypothetical protein